MSVKVTVNSWRHAVTMTEMVHSDVTNTWLLSLPYPTSMGKSAPVSIGLYTQHQCNEWNTSSKLTPSHVHILYRTSRGSSERLVSLSTRPHPATGSRDTAGLEGSACFHGVNDPSLCGGLHTWRLWGTCDNDVLFYHIVVKRFVSISGT